MSHTRDSRIVRKSEGGLFNRKGDRRCGEHADGNSSLQERRPGAGRDDPQIAVPPAGRLLGRLSPAFIAALYAAYLDQSIFLVHSSDGEVNGFALGGSSRVMLSCRLNFLSPARPDVSCRCRARPHLWLLGLRSSVKLIGTWFSSLLGASPCEEFRLISIAVAEHATRNGVGTRLIQGFEAAIRAAGCTYGLNVLKTNTAAIRFYEKLGFQRAGETATAWKLRKVLAANAGMPELRSR